MAKVFSTHASFRAIKSPRLQGFFCKAQQLRQLGDVGGNAPGLVAGEQVCRRTASGLVLEIEMPQRLPSRVADDETLGMLVVQGGASLRAGGTGQG